MSHGDSGFRCRKGGSEGGERGKEAPLVYSPKNDRGGVYPPRLSCPSYPSHLPQFTFCRKTLKFLIIKRRRGRRLGRRDGSVDKGICLQASQGPQGGRRDLTPVDCPLTSPLRGI